MKAKQILAYLLVATLLPIPGTARFRGIVIEDDKGEGKRNPPNTNEDRSTLALSDSFGRVVAVIDGEYEYEYEYEYDRHNSRITSIRGAKKSKKDKRERKNDKSTKKEKER